MASLSFLFHSPTFLSQSSSSSFTSSSTVCFLPGNTLAVAKTLSFQSPRRRRLLVNENQFQSRSFVLRSALDEVSVLDPPPPSGSERDKSELIASLKLKLLVRFYSFMGFCLMYLPSV